MKKSEIQVGKIYHNGKEGRHYQERHIMDDGPQYKGYFGQEDTDCVQYRVIRKGDKPVDGPIGTMTRQSMANWAAGEVQS